MRESEEKTEKEVRKEFLLGHGRLLVGLLNDFLGVKPFTETLSPSSWSAVLRLARTHGVAAMLYNTAERLGCPEETLENWRQYRDLTLRKSLLFDAERQKILEELRARGIWYVPLKGILLREMYPQPLLREFADNDLLFDAKKAGAVRKIMLARGYTFKEVGALHDTYIKPPVYNFEWHKRLVYAKCEKKYFGSIYSRLVRTDEGELRFTAEDFYAYFVSHFKKHYEDEGIGLRAFVDFYLLDKKNAQNADFDAAACQTLLKNLGLAEFESWLKRTSAALFGGEISDEAFLPVIDNGMYGSRGKKIQNNLQKKGRGKYVFNRFFPTYEVMQNIYPVLVKAPVLLPVFWVWRLLSRACSPKAWKHVKMDVDVIKKSKEDR